MNYHQLNEVSDYLLRNNSDNKATAKGKAIFKNAINVDNRQSIQFQRDSTTQYDQ